MHRLARLLALFSGLRRARELGIPLLLCAVALPSHAGTQNRTNDQRMILRVQGLPNQSSTTSAIVERQVIAEFNRRHPEIELIAAEGLRIPNLVNESVTVMMIMGGIAPDVLKMNFRSIDSFVGQGVVMPLDGFLKNEPNEGAAILGRIPAQIKPVLLRPSPLDPGEKHIYGLPGTPMVVGLYYNRELFRRTDLPDRAPSDWKELSAFAKRISELGPQYKGIFLTSGASASWNLMNFLWSADGQAVEETDDNQWRASFNSEAAVDAYMYYYQLTEVERTALRGPPSVRSKNDATLGMFFGYVGDATGYDSERWGFGAVPRGPGGKRGSEINASIYGIFSGIKEERIRAAAFAYIKFITGPEAERIRINAYVELGQSQSIDPTLLRRYGFEEYLILSPPQLEKEMQEALNNSQPEPYGKNCNLVYSEMTYPLDQILASSSIRSNWASGNIPAVRDEMKTILDASVTRTNERMLSYIPPQEMSRRRIVAAIVMTLSTAAFIGLIVYVFKAFSAVANKQSRPVKSHGALPWLFLLPGLGLILGWHYIPLVRGTAIAFLDYNLLLRSSFVGLDNFANALFDPTFWNALLATIHYAAWMLTLGFFAPILLAYALHLIPRHKIFFRTLYYLPAVISGTAVFFLWFGLFSVDGFLNQMLRLLGLTASRAWMDQPALAMLTCILPVIWAGTGPGCLIYLAALKTIPPEQFEASEIDGAGFLQKTRHIVFPALKTLVIINFVGAAAAAFHSSGNILIMTGGGPNRVTEVLSLFIFFEAFTRLRLGSATAMGWIVGSMLIGFTIIQLQRLCRVEFKTVK